MLASITVGSFFSFQSAILVLALALLVGPFASLGGGYRRPEPFFYIVAWLIIFIAWLFSIGLF